MEDESLWLVLALFRAVAVGALECQPDAKGRAEPVAPVPTWARSGVPPMVGSILPPTDELGPADGGRRRRASRPSLGSFRYAQSRHIPEQLLLLEARAMFVGGTQTRRGADLGQRSRSAAFPEKPAHLRITRRAARSVPDELDDRDVTLAGGAQMQAVPTARFDTCPFGIQLLPGLVWLPMRAWITTRKAFPILATGAALPRKPRGSRMGQHPIACEAEQA